MSVVLPDILEPYHNKGAGTHPNTRGTHAQLRADVLKMHRGVFHENFRLLVSMDIPAAWLLKPRGF